MFPVLSTVGKHGYETMFPASSTAGKRCFLSITFEKRDWETMFLGSVTPLGNKTSEQCFLVSIFEKHGQETLFSGLPSFGKRG
jgi:hypothetical protein